MNMSLFQYSRISMSDLLDIYSEKPLKILSPRIISCCVFQMICCMFMVINRFQKWFYCFLFLLEQLERL